MSLAPLYPLADTPAALLLSQTFTKKGDDEQAAQQMLAELALGLVAPAYTGDAADQLTYAVVLQINYQLERGVAPSINKSTGNSHAGNTTAYRDRWVAPDAMAIVERVTGSRTVRYEPVSV